MSRLIMIAASLFITTFAACHLEEGDRCNPLQFSDPCNPGATGLSCVYPSNCGVAYCCPAKVTAQSDPNCQPCAGPDGGSGD